MAYKYRNGTVDEEGKEIRTDSKWNRTGTWKHYAESYRDIVTTMNYVNDTLHGDWSLVAPTYSTKGQYLKGYMFGAWIDFENDTVHEIRIYDTTGACVELAIFRNGKVDREMRFSPATEEELTADFFTAEFQSIDNILNQDTSNYILEEQEYWTIESSGTLKVWKLNGKPVKMEFQYYEENADHFTKLYYKNGELCAHFTQYFWYDPGCGDPDGTRELENDYSYYSDEPDYYVIGGRMFTKEKLKNQNVYIGEQAHKEILGAQMWLEFAESEKTYQEFFGKESPGGYAFGW